MGKLADQLNKDCCGNLMDIGAKAQLIVSIAELEHLYAVRCSEVVELKDEIVELKECMTYE